MGACESTPPATPGDNHTTLTSQRERTFPAFHDPSPLVGLKLVRPHRYAAAGADTSTLLVRVSSRTPPTRRREPGSREDDPEEQSGQPGDTTQVTGSNSYAL